MFKYLFEFFGVFIIILVILTTRNWFFIGLSIAILLFIGTHFYNASFNPITALAHYAVNDISIVNLFLFILTEVLGAIAGIIFYKMYIKNPIFKKHKVI